MFTVEAWHPPFEVQDSIQKIERYEMARQEASRDKSLQLVAVNRDLAN